MSTSNQTFRGKATLVTQGVPFFLDLDSVTAPGVEKTISTQVITAGFKVNLLQVDVTCRIEGVYKVYIDTLVIASGRTGPTDKNPNFNWAAGREVEAGETLKLTFEAPSFRPVTDLEIYLQGREVPV